MPKLLQLSAAASLKKRLRLRIKALRISPAQKKKYSLAVCRKLEKSLFFKDALSIAFYAAAPDELDLSRLAQKALKLKKKVLFPRINGKKIEFHEVFNLKTDFQPGCFGISEPKAGKTSKFNTAPDLILVPGRAFDLKGNRLGRGGGHYDRLLAKWKESVRVGIAFKSQRVRRIPLEKHDIAMDAVVTN